MNFLCKYLGGSHSYGLAVEGVSDIDERAIFCNTEISKILGLNRFDHLVTQNKDKDSCYWEIRNYFNLLQKGNTQALEMLFNKNWIDITPEFENIQKNKYSLIDSQKFFKCLEGYCHSELKLAIGERTGKLGGKRKEIVEKLGFSPKNFVQLIRLSYCGRILFEYGYFPVNIKNDNTNLFNLLYDIKYNPENYTKELLISLADTHRNQMLEAFNNIKYDFKFDEKLANELIYGIYKPFLL